VPSELKKKIQQARLEKKLTQAQLGQLINEKPQVSMSYVCLTSPASWRPVRELWTPDVSGYPPEVLSEAASFSVALCAAGRQSAALMVAEVQSTQ